MSNKTNTTNSRAPNDKLKAVLKDAKSFCSDAIVDSQLKSAIEQISTDAEDLTADQRRQLQEIGQLMTQGHAEPIKAMAKDGSFVLQPSKDRMQLLLSARPPIAGGKPVTTNDIIQKLREQKIAAGVDLPKIKESVNQLNQGQELDDIVIAQGQLASPGTDGSVQVMARTSLCKPLQEVQINLDAPDPEEKHLCMQDDCVLIHHPPVEGKAGADALGKPLAPPPVQDQVIEAGTNIRVEEHKFIAEITGLLELKNRVLSILPILYFPTDVTQHQGPVDFDGQIIVQTNVRNGARLKATGNITVHGNVEAASIESTQGSITVIQGIVGRNEAILSAKKEIHARFVENASLRADDNIIIEHGTLHSNLVAGHTIDITAGKGHLIGGNTLAGDLVITRKVGTSSGIQTDVSAGLSAKAMRILAKLDHSLQRHTATLQNCRAIIERMHHMVRDPSKMNQSSLASLAKLKQIQLILDVKIANLEKRKNHVMEVASQENTGMVKVLEDVFSGVCVRLGKHVHLQTETARAKQFALHSSNTRILVQPVKR